MSRWHIRDLFCLGEVCPLIEIIIMDCLQTRKHRSEPVDFSDMEVVVMPNLKHLAVRVDNTICSDTASHAVSFSSLPRADADALVSSIIKVAPALRSLKLSLWNTSYDSDPLLLSRSALSVGILSQLSLIWFGGHIRIMEDAPVAAVVFPQLQNVLLTSAAPFKDAEGIAVVSRMQSTPNDLTRWLQQRSDISLISAEPRDIATYNYPAAWLNAYHLGEYKIRRIPLTRQMR